MTFGSQVKISKVAESGEMLNLCSTDSSKIAITFELIMQFGRPLRFRIYKIKCEVVYFMTVSTISNNVGVVAA